MAQGTSAGEPTPTPTPTPRLHPDPGPDPGPDPRPAPDPGPDPDPDPRPAPGPGPGPGPGPTSDPATDPAADYALRVANGSYDWYRAAAMRSRRAFRLSESLLLLVSAAIPVTAALTAQNAEVPAILGAVVVVITGLRSVFHWQEDYVRFSEAREAVEAERRLYHTGAEPYADRETRDQTLAASVTRIEQREMGTWTQLAAPRADTTGSVPPP